MKREKRKKKQTDEKDGTRRVSGEPESDLTAVGGGGVAGAAAGAAIGSAIGGPVGGAIGAVAGTLAGGVAAEKIRDDFDPIVEEKYWEENFRNRPYYKESDLYEDYLPAYRLSWESARKKEFENHTFEEAEHVLELHWKDEHGAASDWQKIREIVRDGFERMRERQLVSKT